jgi:hypothetical protein
MSNIVNSSVKHWKIYCNTDAKYVQGFLDNEQGEPTVCFQNNTHSINTTKTELLEIILSNHTPIVNKWKITCDTESTDVYGFLPGHITTPVCFNNSTHTISSPSIIQVIHNDQVKIKEASKPVNGYIRIESIEIDIDPGETKIHDQTWDYPICPLSVTLLTRDINKGDIFTVNVSPDKVVGVITSNVSVSDTVLNVSPTVTKHMSIGFPCTITDGTNVEDLGFCVAVNVQDGTITVNTPSTRSFLASTPTYVRLSVRFMGPHRIGQAGILELGTSKIGASYIKNGEIVRSIYINNDTVPKTLHILVEYMY